jgi:alkylated DNA repair dioxygenase AlkB
MSDLFDRTDAAQLPFLLPQEAGYQAQPNPAWSGFNITLPHGEVFYAEQFFERHVSDRTLEYLQENDTADWRTVDWRNVEANAVEQIRFRNIKWKQDWISLYGKRLPLPRLTSWYGDSGRAYTYSGIKSEPNPWNEGLLYLKNRIERCAGVAFNSVLLNWYRDGEDHLNWHADDEKELGRNPIIASANFGASRDFVVRRKSDHAQKITFPLKHGTLLIMRGEMQHHWDHAVPKRKNVKLSRFNLTFRRIGLID